MTQPQPNPEAAISSAPIRGPKPYRPPRLVAIAAAADLLEVLGPAQANYGGTGMGG